MQSDSPEHEEQQRENDDLAFGGICPVCGDEITAPDEDSIETGESYDGKVCILPQNEWRNPDEPGFLIHLPEVDNAE